MLFFWAKWNWKEFSKILLWVDETHCLIEIPKDDDEKNCIKKYFWMDFECLIFKSKHSKKIISLDLFKFH